MAKAVGPIVQLVGAFIGGPAGMVFSFIGGQISQGEAEIEARHRAQKAFNASRVDRNFVVKTAVSPRRYVLGRARVGGTLAYADTVGTKKEKLDVVVMISDGPIKGVAGMWLADTFVAAADFASGAPTVGQYSAANRKAFTQGIFDTLSGTDTFTVLHAPRSAADVNVSLVVGEDWVTQTVDHVSGVSVVLSAPVTGEIHGDYLWVTAEVPYQVQWVLGGHQQAASTWPGVTTPKWTTNHRLQGIAYWRSLCDWDENIFAQGKPSENVLADGVLVHDPRYNLDPVYALTGAVPGAPGTLPTNVNTAGIANGLAREIVATGSEDGVPYFDIRIYGTTSAAGTVLIRLPQASACPAATSGQAWNGRAHVRLLAGLLSQFTSSNLALISYDSGGTGTVEASTALSATVVAYPLRDATVVVADASAGASTTKMGLALRLAYASGATIDTTVRIGLPQLWRTADPVQWTSNPAILAAWWMTLPRSDGGCGIPFEWLDWATVITAANICDETISVKKLDNTGYENVKRYECHTVISTDAAPLDNLAVIEGAMAGYHAFTAGQYKLYAGAHRTPTLTITDADVVLSEPIRFVPSASLFDNSPNVMNGRIVDAARNYVEAGVTPVANDFYIALDGGEEPDELDLPATTDARQAQYRMGVELERRRPRMQCELTVMGIGADIELGRAVAVDLANYADFAGFTWEVAQRGNSFNGRYPLVLMQTRSTDWALDPDKFTPVDQPVPPDNSYLFNVDEVANFTGTPNVPTSLPDGTVVLVIHCTWDLHSQVYVQQSGKIEIRWRRIDVAAWSGPFEAEGGDTAADIFLGAYDKMRYVLQARARNGVPAWSEWVTTVVDAASGGQLDGIDLVLGTRAIVLPADTSGNVTTYAGATSTVSVIRNSVDETGSWTLSRVNSSGVGSTLASGLLTITSMSNVVDAGYVDVTATRSGFPTQTQRVSLGKARAGADGASAFTATATANMTWAGGVATKISGSGTWNGSVRSDQAYPGGAGVAFVADQANREIMIALNSDPATDANYTSLDYALYLTNTGDLRVYESNVDRGSVGSYAAGDVFAIIYNGDSVVYYKNGGAVRTLSSVGAGLLLYLDSSFKELGSVSNLTFYPQAAKGSDAKLLQLSVTSQVFQVAKSGSASPTSVTFTANAQNLTGSPSWSVVAGTATLTGSGSTRTLTYANLTTDTATIQVTQDGLTDTMTVAKIREGNDAIISLLSNEAIVLPADSAGHVTSYAGAVTSMSVFKGTTDDTANWSFSRVNGTGVTSTLASNVLTITALADANDSSYVDITATRSGYATQVKRVKLSKSKQGSDGADGSNGADAPLLTLSATSQIFTFDGNNAASPSSQTISLTAVLANLSGTASFTCTRYDSTGTSLGTVTLGGTGNTRTLTVAQFGAAAYANIVASLSGRSDTVTVVRVRDGTNNVVSDLDNDAATFPADSSGVVSDYGNGTTRMKVWVGLVDDSTNWSYSAAASTGITAALGSGANKNLLTVTAMTTAVDSGYVDITATKSGAPTQVKRFSLSKSKSAPGTTDFIDGFRVTSSDVEVANSSDATARVTIKTNGNITYLSNDTTLTDRNWWFPNQTGVGTGKWVYTSAAGPDAADVTGTLNTWVQLTADQAYELKILGSVPPVVTKTATLYHVFALSAGGTAIGSGTSNLIANRDA